MLVIVDTNILLSALHAEGSPPAAIVDAWPVGCFGLVTSTAQIDEFKRLRGTQDCLPIFGAAPSAVW